ncbi:MAG: hypothetical protein NVS4B10_03150 [Myxococcales bacterium]
MSSQPSFSTARVASGFPKYPRITDGPRTRTRPTASPGNTTPPAPLIATSLPGGGRPTETISRARPAPGASAIPRSASAWASTGSARNPCQGVEKVTASDASERP